MGDSTNMRSALVSRTAKFFNSERLSDLHILVKDQKFYAHKLILSMASEEFASLFYNNDVPNTSAGKIHLKDVSSLAVHKTLLYVYTDELNLTNVKEAMEVYKLATKFNIKDLVVKCRDYVGLDRITEENVFFIYDIALKEDMKDSLLKCRELVCLKTSAVFSTKQFLETSVPVLQDILNRDSLAFEKEMDVIRAVLRWCRQDCERRGRPTETVCMRDSIGPFLPFLRFLTISIEELYDFVEENNLFSNSEMVLLTRKIMDPNQNCSVPSGFCPITRRRGTVYNHNLNSNVTKYTPKANIQNSNGLESCLFVRQQSYNETPSTVTRPLQQECSFVSDMHDLQIGSPTYAFLQNGVKNENPSMHSKTEVPLFQFPSATTKKPSLLKVMPPPLVPKKKYEFPLQEMQKGMSSMSKRDLICSAEITVLRGSMMIHGIELKVLNSVQFPDEYIRVCLTISGNFPEKNAIEEIKLSNELIPVTFSEPLKLCNDSAKIEVIVEDLKLNRCKVCKVPSVKLISDLNFSAVINLKSNQSNEADGFFFLISRMIYN